MKFHLDTPLAKGFLALLARLDQTLTSDQSATVFLAGGMAVHLYTGKRVTTDVDAEFSRRLFVPANLVVEIPEHQGYGRVLYFDTQFNPMFALLHEDYQTDALPLDLSLPHLDVCVLTPVDLAVSKLARFAAIDREDIFDLARLRLFSVEQFASRAEAALSGFAGPIDKVRLNLELALTSLRPGLEQP